MSRTRAASGWVRRRSLAVRSCDVTAMGDEFSRGTQPQTRLSNEVVTALNGDAGVDKLRHQTHT